MKIQNSILIAAIAALLCSCKVDTPEIPTEELYLRNFIMQFGLIDPDQDWNLAERSSVTINLGVPAQKVVVYANVFDVYYRVARCYEVPAGASIIPLDIPVNTSDLAVEIDGQAFVIDIDGKIDVNKAPSRATTVYPEMLNETNVLGWLIVAEDLGSTDDIDFNDFVARMEYTENMFYALGYVAPDQWDVINQPEVLDDIYFSSSRDGAESRASGSNIVTIKAAASGGIKKLWLHYRATESSTDYVIGPNNTSAERSSLANESAALPYEWHRWFGEEDGLMINTCDNTYEPEKWSNSSSVRITPICGFTCDFEVAEGFTFTTYSEAKYESDDPLSDYNFNFDNRQIKGFYITVDYFDVDPTSSGTGTYQAFDLGQAIGQNRDHGLPPQMFLIPDLCVVTKDADGNTIADPTVQNHFRWPTERTKIDDAYLNFNTWVQEGLVTWYRAGRQDKVISDSFISTIYPK